MEWEEAKNTHTHGGGACITLQQIISCIPAFACVFFSVQKNQKANLLLHLQSFLGHQNPRRKLPAHYKQLPQVCIWGVFERAGR